VHGEYIVPKLTMERGVQTVAHGDQRSFSSGLGKQIFVFVGVIFGIGWVDEIAVGAKNLVHVLDRKKNFGFERFMVVQVGVVERGHDVDGEKFFLRSKSGGDILDINKVLGHLDTKVQTNDHANSSEDASSFD
jgi:hypothetical protein